MHLPKSIHVPAILAIGAIALTVLVTSQVFSRKETQPAQASSLSRAVPQSPVPTRAGAYVDDYAQLNAMRDGVIVLPSGVQYEVLKAGRGRQPHEHDTVTVNYRAMLPNGVEFDSTYEQGSTAELQLDHYIVPGLKDALLHMKEGGEWRVTIPAKLGFGGGKLLRKRDLIYEITLIAIEGKDKAQGSTRQKQ